MRGQKNLRFIIKLVILNILISINIYSSEIKLSVAASMNSVINEIIADYKEKNPVEFLINLGGSGVLRKQIEDGAAVDIVFFADMENMEKLKKADLIEDIPEEITIYNTLILAGKEKIYCLDEITKDKQLGIADPKTTPVGRYAKEYLEKSGYFEKLEKNIIYGKDIRSISNYLELGEVDYGFIYRTELSRLKNVIEVYHLDDQYGTEAQYSFGIVKGRATEDVLKFFEYLGSEEVIYRLDKAGYKIRKNWVYKEQKI